MKTNKLLLSALALTISSTSFGQYIPQDFNNEPAIPAHTYWESHGQILNTEGHVVEDLRYYTIGTGPKIFAFDDKISFAHYSTDTLVSDTAWRLDMEFVCDPSGEGEGFSESVPEPCGMLTAHEKDDGHLNYYLEHTGAGLEGVEGHHRLVYENAWPNIDFHLYSNRIGVKFYIVVQPGGNPNDILFKFTGQDNITTPAPGVVKMFLGSRSVKFPLAFAWQENGGGTPTALMWLPTWNLTGSNNDKINITTGTYDTGKPLVIQLGGDQGQGTDNPNDNSYWSTYMGDNMNDYADGVDTDDDGDVYLSGSTESAAFPVADGQNTFDNEGGADVFAARFRKSDRKHIWTTVVGGTSNDVMYGMDHNGVDKVYISGVTTSSTMIPGGGFNNLGNYKHGSHGNEDGFLIRLDDNQGNAEWITHFGGTLDDGFYDVHADASNVYVAGYAESTNGSQTCGTPGGTQLALCDPGSSAYFQSTHGGGSKDVIVARFNNSGSLTYSSYMGGDEYDVAFAISKDQNGRVFVAGRADGGGVPSNVSSPCGVPANGEFPLCDLGGGAYYQDGNPNGFIIRLDANLQLEQGTFFGNTSTVVSALDFTSDTNLIAVGSMTLNEATTNTCSAPGSNSFPVCALGSEYNETHDGSSTRYNSFISRFDENGVMLWSTPYGKDSYNDGIPSVAIDDDDNVYMLSSLKHDPTTPPNSLFPGQYFPGYYQQWEVQDPSIYDVDATLVAFDVNNERQWATVFGADTSSSQNDWDRADNGKAIATYASEDLLIAGVAASVNFYQACPVPGTSYCQPVLSDLTDDAFVTQFNIEWLVTQIEERKAQQQVITLYPNPVNDVLTVQISDAFVGSQLSVMSMDGRIIWNTQQTRSSGLLNIPTSGLAQGVYMLCIKNNGEIHTAKFVKQ